MIITFCGHSDHLYKKHLPRQVLLLFILTFFLPPRARDGESKAADKAKDHQGEQQLAMRAERAKKLLAERGGEGNGGEDQVDPIRAAKAQTDTDTDGIGDGVIPQERNVDLQCRKGDRAVKGLHVSHGPLVGGNGNARAPKHEDGKEQNEERGHVPKHKGAVATVASVARDRIEQITDERKRREEHVEHRSLVKVIALKHGKRVQKGQDSKREADSRSAAEDGADEQGKSEQTDECQIGAVVTPRILEEKELQLLAQGRITLGAKDHKLTEKEKAGNEQRDATAKITKTLERAHNGLLF